jgi:hypothetical protein
VREKLSQGRWNLTEAASGAEAFECLHESVSEILLLDPLLPDLESANSLPWSVNSFPVSRSSQ